MCAPKHGQNGRMCAMCGPMCEPRAPKQDVPQWPGVRNLGAVRATLERVIFEARTSPLDDNPSTMRVSSHPGARINPRVEVRGPPTPHVNPRQGATLRGVQHPASTPQ